MKYTRRPRPRLHECADLFGTARPEPRHLIEVHADGKRLVCATAAHYRDTLRSILAEVNRAFVMWPTVVCVVAVGGEYNGVHFPRSLYRAVKLKGMVDKTRRSR